MKGYVFFYKHNFYKHIQGQVYPHGSRPGILYGNPKVHKPVIDNCPEFRPILSSIGTPTYKLPNF